MGGRRRRVWVALSLVLSIKILAHPTRQPHFALLRTVWVGRSFSYLNRSSTDYTLHVIHRSSVLISLDTTRPHYWRLFENREDTRTFRSFLDTLYSKRHLLVMYVFFLRNRGDIHPCRMPSPPQSSKTHESGDRRLVVQEVEGGLGSFGGIPHYPGQLLHKQNEGCYSFGNYRADFILMSEAYLTVDYF